MLGHSACGFFNVVRKEELNSIKGRWEKRCLREREVGRWVWQVWKEGTFPLYPAAEVHLLTPLAPSHPILAHLSQSSLPRPVLSSLRSSGPEP